MIYYVGFCWFAGGLLMIASAVFEWSYLMNHPQAQSMIRRLGRKGAKIFYIILGAVLILIGIVLVFLRLIGIDLVQMSD